MRRFQPILPRSSLLTIYKTFIRSQLDFADVAYDQARNSSFHEKLESIQYNACMAITGAIRGTSSEKLYQELGLESLKSRRWFRKLCHFYKILNEKSPSYLFDLIPNLNRVRETRHSNNIPAIHTRHNYFKNSFFPSTISEWNNLDCKIRKRYLKFPFDIRELPYKLRIGKETNWQNSIFKSLSSWIIGSF